MSSVWLYSRFIGIFYSRCMSGVCAVLQCCQQPDSDVALTFKLTQRLQCHRPRERLVHQDITRGREATAITAVNVVDDADFPADFVYVADYVETMPIAVNRVITSLQVHWCNTIISLCHCCLICTDHCRYIIAFSSLEFCQFRLGSKKVSQLLWIVRVHFSRSVLLMISRAI